MCHQCPQRPMRVDLLQFEEFIASGSQAKDERSNFYNYSGSVYTKMGEYLVTQVFHQIGVAFA